jgi:hypothetical protein
MGHPLWREGDHYRSFPLYWRWLERALTNWPSPRHTPPISHFPPTFHSLHTECLIRHGPHRKHRVQYFFYCCVCIRCHKNVFTSRCLATAVLFDSTIPLGGGDTDTPNARWSHNLLFFRNKESRLKMEFLPIKRSPVSSDGRQDTGCRTRVIFPARNLSFAATSVSDLEPIISLANW